MALSARGMLRGLLAVLIVSVAMPALGQEQEESTGVPAQPSTSTSEDASEAAPEIDVSAIEPPRPLENPPITYPADAPPITEPIEVKAHVRIAVDGSVPEVTIVEGATPELDEAVVEAVKQFRFEPAKLNGEPVEVVVPFSHTFVPPPKPVTEDAAPELDAILEGVATTMGTRSPVAHATVFAKGDGGEWLTTTDEKGHFVLPVRSGPIEVRVVADGHKKFVQYEHLPPNLRLKVKYLVERETYGLFQSITRAERDRTEVSRTTLSGREITKVPGTFGDPFRVMMVLPGVGSVMSLLPLPIVRGSSPGNTGIFLDGVRLPLLFHLLGGPSVIHPEFVDSVDFYPGGFPVQYGGYTGGIINGNTRRARPDESRLEFDLNLVQAGAFARHSVDALDMTATVAGRIGYPGVLLSLVAPEINFNYWDYQARFDFGSMENAWSVFFYGAEDAIELRETEGAPWQNLLRFTFHRLDLRHRRGPTDNNVNFRLVFGYDDSAIGPETSTTESVSTGSWSIDPQLRWHWKLDPRLELNTGVDGSFRGVSTPIGGGEDVGGVLLESGLLTVGGAFTELVLTPIESLRIIPGVRADLYNHKGTTQWNVDPRLTVRYRVYDGEVGGTWLKGMVGRYHQPPRFFVPMPGADTSSLSLGLLESTQVSIGAETRIAPGIELDVQTYYNHMDPLMFDLAFNQPVDDVLQRPPSHPPWELPPPGSSEFDQNLLGNMFGRQRGRSYGLEVMLRKRDSERLFGWISYTLSRSERQGSDSVYRPSDFDRLHILNVVAGIKLPRNWELGGRLLLQSGTPLTTLYGYNDARSDGQFRFDLRVDKRAVWKDWLLDFYVDIINATVARESGGVVGGQPLRYIIPTVGFRAVL